MENYSILVPSYTVGPEAYKKIPNYCGVYGRTAVVIGGEKAMAAAKDKLLAAVAGSQITLSSFIHYGSDCTFETAKALEALPQVASAEVSHTQGTAVVTLSASIDDAALKQAVEAQDYKVLDIR